MTPEDQARADQIRARADAATDEAVAAAKRAWPSDSQYVADWHPTDQELHRREGWKSFSERAAAVREQGIRRVVRAVLAAADVPWLLDRLAAATERADKAEAAVRALGPAVIERAARNPGCTAWRNCDGTVPTDLVDGEIVERTVYRSEWRVVESAALFPAEEAPSE